MGHILNPMAQSNVKEQKTVQWLSQAISEIRKEMAEVQQISSESSREFGHRRSLLNGELLKTRADIQSLKLEMESLRSRQETVEAHMADLQSESAQAMVELRKNVNAYRNQVREQKKNKPVYDHTTETPGEVAQ